MKVFLLCFQTFYSVSKCSFSLYYCIVRKYSCTYKYVCAVYFAVLFPFLSLLLCFFASFLLRLLLGIIFVFCPYFYAQFCSTHTQASHQIIGHSHT